MHDAARETLATALQARIGQIANQIPLLLLEDPQAPKLLSLVQEGKACQSALDRIFTVDEEGFYVIADKMAERYGTHMPRRRRTVHAERERAPLLYCSGSNSPTKVEMQPGTRFGSWTVLHEELQDTYGYFQSTKTVKMRRFAVKCVCGTESVVHMNNLRMGYSRSCGCERRH